MPLPPPVLDHVVIDVRDRLDAAAEIFASLGFRLTPRGRHTLGSANHLAVFATDYLELLGFGGDGAIRPELQSFPIGLNGLVFKTADADAVYRHASAAGLPIQPVQSFSRPVEIDGCHYDARFRTARLDQDRIAIGRVYFCEHLTPELVWRAPWQAHPNGARQISRVAIATPDPRRTAALFAALFGAGALHEADGICTLQAGPARVELTPPDRLRAEVGEAAAAASGRATYLAALELQVAAIAHTAEALRTVPGISTEPGRAIVPAAAACNTTLIFTV
jgi:catechol 2,3-dioxygenase-like lactoylglutathione lyase family enzyme